MQGTRKVSNVFLFKIVTRDIKERKLTANHSKVSIFMFTFPINLLFAGETYILEMTSLNQLVRGRSWHAPIIQQVG